MFFREDGMGEEEKKDAGCGCHQPTASPEQADSRDRECAKEKAEQAAGAFGTPPPIDFSTFIYSMATQVFIHLGEAKLPGLPESEVDLPAAKQTIDIIELLEKKTRGNLTDSESKLISNLLYDLRLRYVKAAKAKKETAS